MDAPAASPPAIAVPAVDRCAPQPFRWQDDCSGLQGRRLESLAERLRYLPVSRGEAWVTLGGELRYQIEAIDHPDLGVRSASGYAASDVRALVQADLRTRAGPRLFVQLSAAVDEGRRPFARPFDRSDPDLAQAFVDLPARIGPWRATLRLGRQELSLGPNRLVAARDGANLRRAFDLAELRLERGDVGLTLFSGRPVLNRPGAFDDRSDPGEHFAGGDLHLSLGAHGAMPVSLDVFGLERARDAAVYQQGAGPERRKVLGLRLAGIGGAWDVAVQASRQFGRFRDEESISASGVSVEAGHRWSRAWGQPRLGVVLGRASGDRDPADRTLGTFDPLYPNLGYFTDAPVYYPGNAWDVQPSLTVAPLPRVTLQTGADVIFRLSPHDALYAPPGVPLIAGTGQDGRYAMTLAFAKAWWRAPPHWEASVSLVHGFDGGFVRAAHGRPLSYGRVQAVFRF